MEYAFDAMDRPGSIAWRAADGTLLRGFEMAYNAVGMVTNVTNSGTGVSPVDHRYAFDSLDRLVGERQLAPDGTPVRDAAYAYDLVGNRTQTVIDSATENYTLGVGNRLATYGANSYTHDAAGCVTRIARAGQPALDLAWDAQYRLTAVSTNGVVVEAYGYDPFGRRAWTTTYPLPVGEGQGEGVKTLHMYVGIHCVADLDADGTVLRSYTHGPGVDNLLAITDHTTASPTVLFALTDHLGTVHALADASGAIVESYSYDAWGNVLAVYDAQGSLLSASSLDNRFLFQGREHSWATGLTNFRARWYDPATGRWLSNDPIGISGGLNQYVFCGNDPVNYVDPFGLKDFTRDQLENALKGVKWGQRVAFDSAQLGVPPKDTPTRKGLEMEIANPLTGSSDPVVNEFEKNLPHIVKGVGAHILGQTANAVDGLVLDKPGNFWNYWGMIEVWRHQQLIDSIQKRLDAFPADDPPKKECP